MNVNQLKYLHAVIHEGSYADAARLLYVSPQAISKAVRALEDELGFALFRKEGRSVAPTELAVRFSLQAEDALRSFDDLSAYATGCRTEEGGERSILLAAMVAPYRCRGPRSSDFTLFRAKNPLCRLEIRFMANENCAAALESHVVDAALMQGRLDRQGVECHRVGSIRPCAVMRAGNALSRKSELRFADLNGMLLARPYDMRCAMPLLKRGCRTRHAAPRFVDLIPSLEANREFLKQGGIILATRGSVLLKEPDAVAVPFASDEGLRIPLYLAYASADARAMAPLYAYVADLAKRRALRRI